MGPHAHPEVSMHTHSFADYVACLERGDWAGGSESDYLRDAAQIFDGLRIDTNRGLTRWMDTNTFYRHFGSIFYCFL